MIVLLYFIRFLKGQTPSFLDHILLFFYMHRTIFNYKKSWFTSYTIRFVWILLNVFCLNISLGLMIPLFSQSAQTSCYIHLFYWYTCISGRPTVKIILTFINKLKDSFKASVPLVELAVKLKNECTVARVESPGRHVVQRSTQLVVVLTLLVHFRSVQVAVDS